jgi:hypothetical protein
LFPVRFLFTAGTGWGGTNDAAAERYLAQDESPGAALVGAALDWRTRACPANHSAGFAAPIRRLAVLSSSPIALL